MISAEISQSIWEPSNLQRRKKPISIISSSHPAFFSVEDLDLVEPPFYSSLWLQAYFRTVHEIQPVMPATMLYGQSILPLTELNTKTATE
jgi:hypothetical protein